MSVIADRFPSLARHWAVLRESWREQSQSDRTRRPQEEYEFLPAALEITETPPSPGLRILMLLLCSLFAIALLWSFIGKVDVVAVATGKTLPVANVKVIQPVEIGSVRAIHVRNGQRVRKGQLLIELDPTLAGAEEDQATQGLLSAQIARARNDALLAHLTGGSERFVAPPGTPADVARTQTLLIQSAIAEYEAERASLTQSRAEHLAELAGSNAEIQKLRQTLPLIDQQLEARRDLAAKGHFPKLKVLEYEQLRVEHIQNIAVQESVAAKARAAIANLDAQVAKLRQTFAKQASSDLSTAEDESSLRGSELRKSERRRFLQQLRSPVDGTVQQLAVHTVGGVVQPAQALMVIVPSGTDIEVEAQILNKDIGFVREGQAVRVKFEAFPFTDYGLLDGVVETISRDAIQDEKIGLVYAARIKLNRNYLTIRGRRQPIGPGMAVQAEVKTAKRRIIQYLLSPISQTIDEAGRER
ncbi:HlyD family type I secretion periplasmic adaptor subunit [Allosphingosinicella deserti]|uniref:Membrane fusion protein (MFP) family protein n=1 Tax=Allosphingosinicella deserti TaxID=2116704 RepID=A0A2P7QS36_9SPHN|nr:HlyD family type I secretion periplasmic adaptor subunit [Sphingomonas deserti]PSJ40788.1 HlyD family type I secretion periplasmic adaptor subunit [Sphingomonas deserti]